MAIKFKQGEQVRVNLRTNVDGSAIRTETRDGREVIVVPSYTLPDDIVMNDIFYPAGEIAESYESLVGTPAPLGHPIVNGEFVSAKSPLGLNVGYFGAWNASATPVNGRIFVEKVIDVARANESEMGRRVLAAIEAGDPIHTSTGLMMSLREHRDPEVASWEGFNMAFDHDAILLDESGAATPEQGVGMMINDARVKVINSDIAEGIGGRSGDPSTKLFPGTSREEAATLWGSVIAAFKEALALSRKDEPSMQKEHTMADEDKGGLDQLISRISTLETRLTGLDEVVANMGAATNSHKALFESIKTERTAARNALAAEAVELKVLSEEDAKATPVAALQALINAAKKPKAEVKAAPGVPAAFGGNASDASLAEDWEK